MALKMEREKKEMGMNIQEKASLNRVTENKHNCLSKAPSSASLIKIKCSGVEFTFLNFLFNLAPS